LGIKVLTGTDNFFSADLTSDFFLKDIEDIPSFMDFDHTPKLLIRMVKIGNQRLNFSFPLLTG
tara:strand:- start:14045 stop:14233 length:189 start_codon:yes stop_codon:yes gene_type:complete